MAANAMALPPPIAQTKHRRPPLALRPPKDTRSEAARLSDGAAELEALDRSPLTGYAVMLVNQRIPAAICHCCSRESRKRGGPPLIRIYCKACGGEGFSPSTNSSHGVPDSFVYRHDWPRGVILPIEWKDGPSGRRTTQQEQLEHEGRIMVVWDTLTLFRAVYRFESSDPRINPHPELLAWLRAHDPAHPWGILPPTATPTAAQK